jgi:hypothetical protein
VYRFIEWYGISSFKPEAYPGEPWLVGWLTPLAGGRGDSRKNEHNAGGAGSRGEQDAVACAQVVHQAWASAAAGTETYSCLFCGTSGPSNTGHVLL